MGSVEFFIPESKVKSSGHVMSCSASKGTKQDGEERRSAVRLPGPESELPLSQLVTGRGKVLQKTFCASISLSLKWE